MGIVGTRMACGNADDVCLAGGLTHPKNAEIEFLFPMTYLE